MLDGRDRPPEQFFKLWQAKQPERGGARKDPALNHMGAVFAARQMYSDLVNMHLEQHGHAARLNPRSLSDRGIARAPEPKLLPSDSNRLKYHAEVTPGMQAVFDHRYAREPQVDAEHAQANDYWEGRKVTLGISPDMPMHEQMARIIADRLEAITRTPERRSGHELDHEAQTLTHSISGLQKYTQRVQAERVIEEHYQHDYQRPQSGQRNAERVLAAAKDYGLPRDHGAERAVRLLDHLSREVEPTVGAGLRVRLSGYGRDEHERDEDRGLSW
jgi:hypothetical protein